MLNTTLLEAASNRARLLLVGLLLVTAGLWGIAMLGELQFDDFALLDSAAQVAGIRPLTKLSLAFDLWLFGRQPAAILLHNIVLHLGCVALVFLLARQRLRGEIGALVAALVFAWQPAHGDVVAMVAGRSTGLMTLLVLAALAAYEAARNRGDHRWHAAAAVLFVAAVAAKEVALAFVPLLALWEWTREDRPPAVRQVLAFALLGLAAVGPLLLSSRYRELLTFSLELRSPLASLATNARAVPVMLSLWVRPWALSVDHELGAQSMAAVAGGASLLALLFAGAVLVRRRRPLVSLALAWPLLSLLPTSSLIAKLDPVSERPLYLALVGPALALGGLAQWGLARKARPALALVLLVGLAAATLTAMRAHVFSDARLLWRDAALKAPNKARCWNNLGMSYWQHDELQHAEQALNKALAVDPSYVIARTNLHYLELVCDGSCEDP